MKLHHATLTLNAQGTPQSQAFDDVYYSNENGMAESEYVFIEGNQLDRRWQNHHSTQFNIAETGFGTGLNFLLCLNAFAQFKAAQPDHPLKQLYFLSVEKFPIEKHSLEEVLTQWPSLASLANDLLRQYPPPLSGIHRCHFKLGHGASVVLDLALGDAQASFAQIHSPMDGLIDAWFLDGFAPKKNESMWSDGLYQQMARLSRAGSTLATFTAAGAVKRGLESAGFSIKKIKGFGRKREMITASFSNVCKAKSAVYSKLQPPYFARLESPERGKISKREHVAIVGAGLAGVLTAFKLVEAGKRVTLICEDAGPAQGASGNPIGGFYPQLNAEAGVNSQFFVHAFLYAKKFYDDLLNRDIFFDHQWCGVLQLAFNDNTQTRLQKMIDKGLWPESLAKAINTDEASKIANIAIPYDALYLPDAGWIAPKSLIEACLASALQSDRLECLYNHRYLSNSIDAQSPEQLEQQLSVRVENLHSQSTHTIDCDAVVLACGHKLQQVLASQTSSAHSIPLRLTRGQVEAAKPTPSTAKLKSVLCHKGYFTPAVQGTHALGSSYVKNDIDTKHRVSEAQQNIAMHQKAMSLAPWIEEFNEYKNSEMCGRAAIRLSTPDHLPIAGLVPNLDKQSAELAELYKALPAHKYPMGSSTSNVFILSGLGSRGITTAPILAELIVSQILGKPLPLSNQLLNALNPNRFLVRSLIKQQR